MIDDLFDDDLELDDDLDDIINATDDTDVSANYNDGADRFEPSFKGSAYTDAEISRMRSDVEHAEYVVKCRANDVHNWEVKVSLCNTKEKIQNGDYHLAVRRLNEARSSYNNAVDSLNKAISKLNHAQ